MSLIHNPGKMFLRIVFLFIGVVLLKIAPIAVEFVKAISQAAPYGWAPYLGVIFLAVIGAMDYFIGDTTDADDREE